MNRYLEGVLLGISAAIIATVAGVGAQGAAPLSQLLSPNQSAALAESPADPHPVQAVQSVDVRSRVSGRIVALSVGAHQDVQQGEVLMRVDSTRYQTVYDKARRKLTESQWRYEQAVAERTRATYQSNATQQAKDVLQARIAAAEAASAVVQQNEAAVAQARADLDATQIKAPISGQLESLGVSVGSAVRSGETRLATVRQSRSLMASRSDDP